jgi:hypothetical protein
MLRRIAGELCHLSFVIEIIVGFTLLAVTLANL